MLTLNKIKEHCADAFRKAGYNINDYNIDIVFNNRLRATLGQCVSRGVDHQPIRLEFSKQLIETTADKDVVEVIYHECAHALVGIETRERHGHDVIFKNMCARIGCSRDVASADVERVVAEDKIYKYFVVCAGCGKVVSKYHRAGKVIKNADLYTTKCCNAKILVQTNW